MEDIYIDETKQQLQDELMSQGIYFRLKDTKGELLKKLNSPKINIDLSVINRLEGPVSYTVLEPTHKLNKILKRTGPKILLLGDIHIGNGTCENCSVENGCYSLYNTNTFLQYMNEQATITGLVVDFFIETWVHTLTRTTSRTDIRRSTPKRFLNKEELKDSRADLLKNSSMEDTMYMIRNCFGRLEDCPFNNIRVHMADPRNNKRRKYSFDKLFATFTHLKKKNAYELITDIGYDQWIKFPKFDPVDITRLLYYVYINGLQAKTFFNEPLFHQHSMTYKEFIQLPIQLQIILKYGSYTINFHKTSLMVDLYTICRILKTPKEEGEPSQFSIVYLGDAHIENIVKLLTDTGLYTIKLEKRLVRTNQPFEDIDKCIIVNDR